MKQQIEHSLSVINSTTLVANVDLIINLNNSASPKNPTDLGKQRTLKSTPNSKRSEKTPLNTQKEPSLYMVAI